MSENALGKASSDNGSVDKDSSVPVHRREEWLREHYWDKEESVYEMADIAGVSARTVSDWMDKKGVEKRGNHKRAHAVTDGDADDPDEYRSEGWLRNQYVEQNKSVIEMADSAGVTPTTICNWMDAAGVETRGPHQRDHITQATASDRLADESWLREKYVEEELSSLEIGERVERTAAAVRYWMDKHGIDARDPIDAVPRGEDHPDWDGGHTIEYGGEWIQQREKAIQRDGEACRRCGLSREKAREESGRDLHVHHIRKLKEFDDISEGHKLSNLLTVCQPCHDAIEGIPIDVT